MPWLRYAVFDPQFVVDPNAVIVPGTPNRHEPPPNIRKHLVERAAPRTAVAATSAGHCFDNGSGRESPRAHLEDGFGSPVGLPDFDMRPFPSLPPFNPHAGVRDLSNQRAQ